MEKNLAIVLFGPPGSGKGTQASLLAHHFGLIHYDTGRFLEKFVHNPANLKTAKLKAARDAFDRGDLLDSDIVLQIVKNQIRRLHAAGFGLVLSGSPRRPHEAFGDRHTVGLMALLERLYSRRYIYIVELVIPPAASLNRNQTRLLDPLMDLPIMGTTGSRLTASPFTGAKLVRRHTIDNPKVIRERLEEYQRETAPLEQAFKKHGYRLTRINGAPLPYRVFASILKHIK